MKREPVCRVSIVIKALNEERRIATAIETALHAVRNIGGEVILADSCSTDRTVEIATRYPITVVQLKHAQERCCGIGPQLGYQYAQGEFIYILDGDMEMLDGFLDQAVAFMDQHADVAGVGGQVVEKNTHSLEYLSRIERAGDGHMQPGEVDRLDMGGLYRRAAIEQSGYFSNRNLHSYEEFDLALRLRVRGWRLWRLVMPAVNHYGHDTPHYQLLIRRWRSQYICGLGELLRAALGQAHWQLAISGLRELKIYIGILVWAVGLLLIPALAWAVPAIRPELVYFYLAFAGAPFLLMTLRKRSVAKAIYSVVSWLFNAAGLLKGFLRTPTPATSGVESIRIEGKMPSHRLQEGI